MNIVKRSPDSLAPVKATINNYNRFPRFHHETKLKECPRLEVDYFREVVDTNYFPLIRTENRQKLIPGYVSVLTRDASVGIHMRDLDMLQQDIEKLLSICAVRYRILNGEKVEKIDRIVEIEQPPVKKFRLDDKLVKNITANNGKDGKTGRMTKGNKHFALPSNSNGIRPKLVDPRTNEMIDFWSTLEPFYIDINQSHIHYLERLLKDHSVIDMKIPELGEYYAMQWTENIDVNDKQYNSLKTSKNKGVVDIKKQTMNCILDTFSSPLTQRLFDTFIEERNVFEVPCAFERLQSSDFVLRAANGQRPRDLDRRLRKELLELGIIDIEDISKTYPPDEILQQIRRIQDELTATNQTNISDLNKLISYTHKDMERQEVKHGLAKVDNELENIINAAGVIRNTKPFINSDMMQFRNDTSKLVNEQTRLHRVFAKLNCFPISS